MKKQKITVEYSLKSTSPNIIWGLISTEGGLSRWIADDVKENKGKFTFSWGDTWSHHESRTASTLDKARHSFLRLQWDDETDPDAYLELRMSHSEVTGGFTLHITDFALEEDIDSLYDIWEQNLEQLRQTSGL